MKRNNLTTAVVAGLTGVAGMVNLAGAVDLNPDGLGQVLIYPYYTVNGGNSTLIAVVNTTANGKAVKVRFLEGYNSREVLDFNLFLSPFDMWTGAVFDTSTSGTGAGGLVTSDESCTAPAIRHSTTLPTISPTDSRRYIEFRNGAYTGATADGGPTTLARTREGHIEMIEMANLVGPTNPTLDGITHVAGVPDDCSVTVGFTPSSARTTDLSAPTGGLFGAGSMINVAQGVMNAYNADAIEGFYTAGDTALFTATGSTFPSLASVRTTGGTAVAHVFTGNGNLVTSTYTGVGTATTSGYIDAVSAVFAVDTLYNEFVLESAAGAESEWVITFPTKRYYVDRALIGSTATAAYPPFERPFNSAFSCVVVGLGIFDREEGQTQHLDDFSPQPTTPPSSLCYEAQVISFLPAADYTSRSGRSSILGSILTTNIDARALGFQSGWLRLDLTAAPATGFPSHVMRPSALPEAEQFLGLPATGFLAVNFTNRNVTPGVLANYSALYRHRASRSCIDPGVVAPATGGCS